MGLGNTRYLSGTEPHIDKASTCSAYNTLSRIELLPHLNYFESEFRKNRHILFSTFEVFPIRNKLMGLMSCRFVTKQKKIKENKTEPHRQFPSRSTEAQQKCHFRMISEIKDKIQTFFLFLRIEMNVIKRASG